MGTWGTSLYSNDSTSDVRDTYLDFLEKQAGNQEAYEKTLEKYKEYIGDQDEPLLWFALADTQWRVGRLMPEVKEKALEWIERGGYTELWEDNKKGLAGWKKTLEKLKIKLKTEQPKEKSFRRRPLPFQNPWGLNDVYAFRAHSNSVDKESRALLGKYLLMQKIGEGVGRESPDTIMRVQIFDRIFDDMPTVDDVYETLHSYRLLPFSNPRDQLRRYKLRLKGRPDPFYGNEPLCIYDPVGMSAKMDQYRNFSRYPKDELTYICTSEGPPNIQHERTDGNADYTVQWNDFIHKIGWLLSTWKDVDYEIIGDGTFEYPTREQQEQISAEVIKKQN